MSSEVPIITHRRVVCGVLTILGLAAWIVFAFVFNASSLLLDAACILAIFVPTCWLAIAESRLRRRLRENNYCLCPQCGHSLVGLDESGQCPECGRAFVLEGTREIWVGKGLARRSEVRRQTEPRV